MPSYLATSNNDAIKTAEQVLLDGTQTIAGVEDVLVDGQSVVRDNVAHIDLSGKQDKLTVTEDLTLSGAELGVNKEKIQEKLSAGNNIEIIDNVISAKAVQPNIDSIAVNRTVLIPDENKQVNITINKATIDLANVDNTSDINKPVSTAQQAAIDVVADKLNKDVVTDVTFTLNGDTLDATVNRENLSTGSKDQSGSEIISGATQDSAGLMTAADVKSLSDLQTRVGNLEGKTTRLLYTEKTNPTATEINTFVTGLGYTVPFDGIAVVIQGTYHIWHYYSNDNIGWRDDGQDTVSTFTNDIAGIIKGAGETDGKVYAETDGTGSIYGWDALKSQVSDNKTNIDNKLDKVTTGSILPQAYVKNSDGSQGVADYIPGVFYFNYSGTFNLDDFSSVTITDGWNSSLVGEYYRISPCILSIEQLKGGPIESLIYGVTLKSIRNNEPDSVEFVGVVGYFDTYYNVTIVVDALGTIREVGIKKIENAGNKVTAITSESTDAQYPSAKAVVGYTATAVEAGVSGCERTDNKVTAITDEGSDVQYPSTSAIVKYIKANAPSAYHIELTGDSGTITTEQYNALLADNDSYILHTVGVAVMRLARAVKVEGAQTSLQYQKFIGGIARTISIEASGAWTKTETTYQSTNKLSTTLNSSSTDSQYPSAKATYDADQATLTAAKAYADSLVGDINTALQILDTGTGV